MNQQANHRQKEARKKLKKILALWCAGLIFCLATFIGYIYPRYAEAKKMSEEKVAAEAAVKAAEAEKQRLAEESSQRLRRRIEELRKQKERESDFLMNFPKEGWVSEPMEIEGLCRGRFLLGKESPLNTISAVFVITDFLPKILEEYNDNHLMTVHLSLISKSKDLDRVKREYEMINSYASDNLKNQTSNKTSIGSVEFSYKKDDDCIYARFKFENLKTTETIIILVPIANSNTDDAVMQLIKHNEFLKYVNLSASLKFTAQEEVWRLKMQALIARNFEPLPLSSSVPPPETTATPPSPLPPAVSSISEKKPVTSPKMEPVESPKAPPQPPPKAGIVLTSEDAIAATVNYLGLACSGTGNAEDASEMFIKDKDIWYYDVFKSYSEMIAESKNWDVKNPYHQFDVNVDSARCTETNNVFDVSLSFTARVGQNEAAAPIKSKRGFFRLEKRNGALRISRISTCGENESEPFPGWVVAKYKARISRQDVSQSGGTLFSSLKFDNEAELFREIILQDRVNYLSGKGDAEDEPSGWFDPEGHNAAKLIEKRREQLARMGTSYSGPKDRFVAGSASAVVEIRHKEKISITILPTSTQ